MPAAGSPLTSSSTAFGQDTLIRRISPGVLAIADMESSARTLVQQILTPAGIRGWTEADNGPQADILVVDVTQLRGDPLGALRRRREAGDRSPAIVLAAHVPAGMLRELLRLGVRDVMLKPYRPAELCEAILELARVRAAETSTKVLSQRLEAERERNRRYAEEIAMLGEIGRAVATLGDLDLILTRVAEAAAYVADAEEASLYLVQPGSDQLVLRASRQAGERHASLQRLRTTDSLAGEVLRTGKPLLLRSDGEQNPLKVQTGFLVQSLIHVPLRIQDRVVGVLGVYNPFAARPFDEHHLTLLVALADWASVALEHAIQSQGGGPQEVIVAPPLLTEGMERIGLLLTPLWRGELGPLSRKQTDQIERTLAELEALQAIPIAAMDARELDSFIDLPGLVQQVIDSLQEEAERKGLVLVAEPTGPMPMFPGDPGRISQVVEGIAAAAVRRTHRGRVVVRTQRFSVRDGQPDERMILPPSAELADGIWAAVTVIDTSAGLSPDTQRALTSPVTDPEAGKTGPGLSMGEIRMIAESLGASLWHEQTPVGVKILFAIPGA